MHIIMLTRVGSHLYGTSTPESDLDVKGVYIPDKRDLYLGNVPRSIHPSWEALALQEGMEWMGPMDVPHKVDLELYSLSYFIELASQGQTIALDMLYAPDSMLFQKTWVWDRVQAHRERFLSKSMRTFIDFSKNMVAKYRNKKQRYDELQGLAMNLRSIPFEGKRLRDIWDDLPEGEYLKKLPPDSQGIRMYQTVQMKSPESLPLNQFMERITWAVKDFGGRVKKITNQEGNDWKAVSHSARSLFQLKEMLLTNSLEFPLKEGAIILKIKKGKLNYSTKVIPLLTDLTREVDLLLNESALPDAVDRIWWDDFLYELLEIYYTLEGHKVD